MKLKFTKDYSGRETAMQEYKAGDTADIPAAQALELVRLGVAKELWADIGRMFDPPKPAQGGVTDKQYIFGEHKPLVFEPEKGDVLITELDDTEAPKPGRAEGGLVRAGQAYYVGAREAEPAEEELPKPAKPKKPRKGKVKRDKNTS